VDELAHGITDVPPPPAPDFGINETIRIFEDTPNVYFKLTEINFERLHTVGIAPARLVRRMADSFGAERLVWGSDVGQSLRWPYPDKAAMGRDAASFLTAKEGALFLHDNAARIYGAVRCVRAIRSRCAGSRAGSFRTRPGTSGRNGRRC
jgi:amidohydrolase family protein